MKLNLIIAIVAVLTLRRAVQTPGPSFDLPTDKKIDALFSVLTSPDDPGLAVLVRKNGRTLFERSYGVRDLHSRVLIDAHTNFRLASCTKQFTALAIMLLVHDGKLRYDETLTELFPDFPPYGNSITVQNLLNHTCRGPAGRTAIPVTWCSDLSSRMFQENRTANFFTLGFLGR